ncbi:MAG: zf-HC2 domain-containing protein [Candidatus Omnitrophota bacterium]
MADCRKINQIISRYIDHTASSEDIQTVEEHLCVCQVCREKLGKFLDKKEIESVEPAAVKPEISPEERKDIFSYFIVFAGIIIAGFVLFLFLSSVKH